VPFVALDVIDPSPWRIGSNLCTARRQLFSKNCNLFLTGTGPPNSGALRPWNAIKTRQNQGYAAEHQKSPKHHQCITMQSSDNEQQQSQAPYGQRARSSSHLPTPSRPETPSAISQYDSLSQGPSRQYHSPTNFHPCTSHVSAGPFYIHPCCFILKLLAEPIIRHSQMNVLARLVEFRPGAPNIPRSQLRILHRPNRTRIQAIHLR
jgi:hypothetical protein